MNDISPHMENLFQHINQIKFQHSRISFSKKGLEDFLGETLHLQKQRSVFTCDTHSFRVSEVRGNTKGFSNVVLSLSVLLKYDKKPFVVIVVREKGLQFLASNTTFLKKISHSSHTLSKTNIKGSFLGQDILKEYNDIINEEKNFNALFKIHNQVEVSKNIERLVASTNSIEGKQNYFIPSSEQIESILLSPSRYVDVIKQEEYIEFSEQLQNKIQLLKSKILEASLDTNVNIRGNKIEQIITSGINEHRTEDVVEVLDNGTKVLIDIKTKLTHLSSNPKAFNVDKTLQILSDPSQIFCFLILLIDIKENKISSELVPVLSKNFLKMLRVQHHWAGRNSRGVTQISGDIYKLFDTQNTPPIDEEFAKRYLRSLLDIKK